MGVLVQPRSMAPRPVSGKVMEGDLPPLEDVEFVLVPRRGADRALVEALSSQIRSRIMPPSREA